MSAASSRSNPEHDVTLPAREIPIGRVHPLMQVRQQVEDIFARAIGNEGFILRSPEPEALLEAAADIRQKA